MTVYETDVPGVGRKFEYELGGEDRLVVLIHHDGKREVFRRPSDDAAGE
jgi:TrkA domain protein